jgi:hypothetical protein
VSIPASAGGSRRRPRAAAARRRTGWTSDRTRRRRRCQRAQAQAALSASRRVKRLPDAGGLLTLFFFFFAAGQGGAPSAAGAFGQTTIRAAPTARKLSRRRFGDYRGRGNAAPVNHEIFAVHRWSVRSVRRFFADAQRGPGRDAAAQPTRGAGGGARRGIRSSCTARRWRSGRRTSATGRRRDRRRPRTSRPGARRCRGRNSVRFW